MRYSLLKLSMVGLIALAACGNCPDEVDALAQGAVVANGVSFNGVTFNGVTFNGVTFNGLSFNGVTFNGIKFNGIKFNGVSFNGSGYNAGTYSGTSTATATLSSSQLTVTDSSGRTRSGSDLIGVKFSGQLDNGTTIPVRIDSVSYDSTTRLYQYAISLGADNGTWVPLCGTTSGVAVTAVPIEGNYDAVSGDYTPDNDMFTFACTNAALGKCIVWGYKPWSSSQECKSKSDCKNQPLAEWHAACTRMVRADYCGDGVPHTRNGTSINIWDVFGIQTQATTGWEMEAEWTADGAECIRHTRWVQADTTIPGTDLAYVQAHCPKRLAANSNSWDCRPDRSDFLTKYGYQDNPTSRRLLRNESLNNQ